MLTPTMASPKPRKRRIGVRLIIANRKKKNHVINSGTSNLTQKHKMSPVRSDVICLNIGELKGGQDGLHGCSVVVLDEQESSHLSDRNESRS